MAEKVFGKMFLGDVFEVLISRDIFLCCKTKALRTCGKNPECKTGKVYLRMFIHPRHHAWPRLARINSRGRQA